MSGYYEQKVHVEKFFGVVPAKIVRGELKYRETIVWSLEEAPQLILDV